MIDLTFLEMNQIFGKGKLEIFKKYGTKASISDFAILLGGYVSDFNYTSEGESLENRAGWWWTKTGCGNQQAQCVSHIGISYCYDTNYRPGGSRPAFYFTSIQQVSEKAKRGRHGLVTMEFGEYPQKVCITDLQDELERLYNIDELTKTGACYTTDSRRWDELDCSFSEQKHIEYEYNEKRYVRVEANPDDSALNRFALSDGRQYQRGDYIWVEVNPIIWLVDEKSHIALTKDIVFAGVQFDKERIYKGDFENTDMRRFLDRYFSKEILLNSNYAKRVEEAKRLCFPDYTRRSYFKR